MLPFVFVLGCSSSSATPERAKAQPKIALSYLAKDEVAKLQAQVPGVRLVHAADKAAALREVRDADAIVGRITPELIRAGKRLRWAQVLSAGVDRYLFPELTESNLVLTNAKILQGPNVADQAMALLLALTRRIPDVVRQQGRTEWERSRLRAATPGLVELEGKTALVIGVGGIGSAIARRCAGFGMKVLGIDVRVKRPLPQGVTELHPPGKLHALLPRADAVILAVPLTPRTTKLINAAAFARMKDGAYIVNIARGKVIDTRALLAALKSGKLGGAGLDVTDPEPLPAEHPLWKAPNVLISPHMGGTSDRVWARKLELLRDNLGRFARAEPLRNVVDKKAGY